MKEKENSFKDHLLTEYQKLHNKKPNFKSMLYMPTGWSSPKLLTIRVEAERVILNNLTMPSSRLNLSFTRAAYAIRQQGKMKISK